MTGARIHVVPTAERAEHEISEICPCGPTVEESDDGMATVIHRDVDERRKPPAEA